METQDSLDIVNLQRVALGLEHEPSQSFLSDPARSDSASQKTSNQHPAARSHAGASLSGNRLASTPLSTRQRHPGPSSSPQNATSPMNPKHSATISSGALPTPGIQSQVMEPADAAPGDTQVVSQSVYDSIIRQNEESMYHRVSQTGADGATLMTLHEGDSGHMDLLAEFDSARQQRIPSPDHDEESNYNQSDSSPMAAMEYQPEFFPESQRFLAATPATAVKKSQTPGTSMKTPSLSRNPLAGEIESNGALLGLSQVFKATQAPSSPLPQGQQPELVSDRPSPNIPIQYPRINHNVSSPLAHSRTPFARDSSEPNLNYISLKESQLRRDKTLGERLTRSADNMRSDEIDREFYKESSFVENARRQRQINEETAAQFAALNAPSPSANNMAALPDQPVHHVHEDDAMLTVAGSEEETEQEEEAGPQVPQSQEPPQSSEEDKENYNGPPVVDGASSAHDRLSQALALEQSPSFRLNSMPESGIGHNRQESVGPHDLDHYIGRSSQVMVKDSQQSPQPSPTPKGNVHGRLEQPLPEQMQIDPTSDIDQTSPVRRLQSSPPGSRQGEVQTLRSNTTSPTKDSHLSLHPVLEPGQNTSSHETGNVHSSHPSEPQNTGSSLDKNRAGSGDKPSSMPSRVTETPVHLRPQVNDVARLTSVPETSPNRTQPNDLDGESNGDGLENEDDDLPPMYPAGNVLRPDQPRPPQSRALSSPIKTLQSQVLPQILSSPSGRQRRRLTDIAADASPQIDMKFQDLGLNFFTAEDEEFSSLIDGSPTRPKKMRRGNAGQTLRTSDTTLPATPRVQPPKMVARIPEWPSPEKPQSPAVIHVPASTVRKQVKPSRRTENIWEVGSSPQQVIRRRPRSRHGRSDTSQHVEDQSAPLQKPEAKTPSRPVVIHNPQPAPSSELTEIDVDSEDMLQSETNTSKSPPTTPRAAPAAPDARQIAPSQVLAVWMGQKRAYYPATCFGTPLGVSQTKYSIKFEDSLPVEVVKGAVKRLELRVGDAVKVDMRGVPKVTHIVRGFDDKLTREERARAAENGLYPQTDIFGHTSVILGPKQRKSLPNAGLAGSENVIKVPIARIYLDTILWNQLKDRAFTYQPETESRETRSDTPSEKSSLPATPSTRFARSIYESSGIFAGMAFAVSYKEDEASKNRITRLIMEYGGTVLHEGFTELFEPSSIRAVNTPTKGREDGEPSNVGLRLNGLAENVGFACLIADTHSRREKYMQALALNLPCLSGRWVEDCIAKGRVLDWDIYLLPAGDSMYLNGVTKSRVMVPTPPSQARLADTIDARPKLLEGQSVLIVMGRGKAEEKRKAYVFLTFALGAARVQRVPDLETAKALIDSQSEASLSCTWDLIYVDDVDQAAAKAMLAPEQRTQRIRLIHGNGKKRRKSATFTMSTPPNEAVPTARVVGNEFVCQSLILGRLFEE